MRAAGGAAGDLSIAGRWLALLAWCLAAGFLAPAAAAEVNAADAKRVRAVIETQLRAFAADDAPAAFALAAPLLREQFGSAERFMALVRDNYPVVYRPASVSFLKPGWSSGVLVQSVQMTDAEGGVWLALYQMQRQRDKSWRIGGCVVVAQAGRAT